MTAAVAGEGIDLARLRRERRDKLYAGLSSQALDAVVLLGGSAVQYATGARSMFSDASQASYLRPVAVLMRDDPLPHLFTPYPEGAPPEIDGEHLHPPVWLETSQGASVLSSWLLEVVPGSARVAWDETTMALDGCLQDGLSSVEAVDAGALLGQARLIKTRDEVECIRRAQQITEHAMYDVQAALSPGVRQSELTAIFLRRIFELGATGNCIDPIWQTVPPYKAAGPFTTHGDLAYPLVSSDRILAEGEVMWVDAGIGYEGYSSDFGRTWIVSHDPSPSREQIRHYRRWRDVADATLAQVRPGSTGADLTRAATEANGGERPWLDHFYLIHGVGTDSAEMPLIGTDLGPDFDASLVLAPGMVLVVEPVIWEEGLGGYRSEDIVAVTDDGYETLSDYPYSPYG